MHHFFPILEASDIDKTGEIAIAIDLLDVI